MAAQVDLPRLEALQAYWQQHPPLHIVVAAALGHKPAVLSAAGGGPDIREAGEYVPVNVMSPGEFNSMLAGFGLPSAAC